MSDGPPRVRILDDYQGVALESADWSALPPGADVQVSREHLTGDALTAFLAPADVVVVMRERTPLPRPVLAALPALRLVVTTGMVNASIDLAAARDLGVTVSGTGSMAGAATELTWALIMAGLRRLPEALADVREGRWQTVVGTELEGRVLGIVGLGHIGRRIARIAAAFDMTVIAWSQNLDAAAAAAVGVRAVSREELFSASDVVTVHLKLSERTTGLVGARELALMKPGAYLVNTSRGPVVDEAALLDAVTSGRIAGAALDVFDVEPLPPGHPFRSTPNILATGHIGYVTRGNYGRYYTDAVADITAWLAGTPIRRLT